MQAHVDQTLASSLMHRYGTLDEEVAPILLHGIVKTDRLIVFGGGAPLVADGRTIGAIGVSSGSSGQDVQIAEAGAAAVS